MGEPAGFLEVVIRPPFELIECTQCEELWFNPLARELPGGRLGAALAKLKRVGLRWFSPGAAYTGISLRLVVAKQ